jgi:hypothetical protein
VAWSPGRTGTQLTGGRDRPAGPAQVVGDLVAAGLLEERPAAPVGRRGRPTSELRFGPLESGGPGGGDRPAGMRVATIGLGRVVSDVVVLPVDGQPQESVRRLGEVLAGRCAALDGRVLGVGGASSDSSTDAGTSSSPPTSGGATSRWPACWRRRCRRAYR